MELIMKITGAAALIVGYMKYFFTDVVDRLTGKPTPDPLTGIAFMEQQIREILIMAACGACVAFMFQAYNGCIQRHVKVDTPQWVRRALVFTDIAFCIIAGNIIAGFWFRSSYGRLSIHEACGLIAGLIIGMHTFAFGKSKRKHTIAVIYVILIITAYFVIS